MTTFTDINAAIEEAVWLSHVHKKPHSVYQNFGGTMEVGPTQHYRNAMFTTGRRCTVNTEYRSAA